MKKKGFTLIELLGVIVILGIVMTLAVIGYNKYIVKGRNKSYNIAEESLKSAAVDAMMDFYSNNSKRKFCNTHSMPEEQYGFEFIYLDELIEDDYIKSIHDPKDTEQICNTESYVYVTNKADTKNVNNKDNTLDNIEILNYKCDKDVLNSNGVTVLDYYTFKYENNKKDNEQFKEENTNTNSINDYLKYIESLNYKCKIEK